MKHTFRKIIKLFGQISENIEKTHLFAYASQATLFVIISIIPFLILLLNALKFWLPISEGTIQTVLEDFLPIQVHPIATSIIADFSKNNVPIISLTSLVLVWTASRGLAAIAKGTRLCLDSNPKSNYLKDSLYSLLHTILFIIIILLVLVGLIFANSIRDILNAHIPKLQSLDEIIKWRYIIFIALLTLVFILAYKFLGKTKIPISKLFIGSLFSSLGWAAASTSYSIYIQNFSKFSLIYGSLAAVMFLLLWVWFCMIIFLLGAQINKFFATSEQPIFKEIKSFWQKH